MSRRRNQLASFSRKREIEVPPAVAQRFLPESVARSGAASSYVIPERYEIFQSVLSIAWCERKRLEQLQTFKQ